MTPDADRDPDDGEDVEVRIVDEPGPSEGEFDRQLTNLLGRLLDTETRGKVYVHVLRDPETTSEEVARGTGLYPETVRRTLADLREEGVVSRQNLEGKEGQYGYTAIPPTELAGRLLGDLQEELDAFFGGEDGHAVDPVTIDVEEASGRNDGESGGHEGGDDEDEDFPAGGR